MEYESHPAAAIFPMMERAELETLAADIKANGLIEPILLYQGKILDGRNRAESCVIAGIEPRYCEVTINGDSPVLYVVSKNLHRRHLSCAQRTRVGLDLIPMLEAEAAERQRLAGAKGREHRQNGFASQDAKPKRGTRTDEQAGKAVGVSGASIRRLDYIRRHDPELCKKVEAGEIPIKTGWVQARLAAGLPQLVEERQAEAAKKVAKAKAKQPGYSRDGRRLPQPKPGTPYAKRRQDAAKRIMVEILSNIRGLCRGVAEFNADLIAPALTSEEKQTWTGISLETSRRLRDFALRLRKAKHDDTKKD